MSDHAEELRCECCGGALKIVCAKNDCADPLEQRRKANGPAPQAPASRAGKKFGVLPDGRKLCRGECGEIKQLSEFYVGQSRCKPCFKLRYSRPAVAS